MLKNASIDDITNEIIDKVRSVTPTTSTDSERFEALRDFAEQIHEWLQNSSDADKERFLELSNEFFASRRSFAGVVMAIPEEAECLVLLLTIIDNPPLIL